MHHNVAMFLSQKECSHIESLELRVLASINTAAHLYMLSPCPVQLKETQFQM